MITWLFRIATVVTLVFALIAALEAGGTCLGENVWVWLSCGLLAGFFALFFAAWFDAQIGSVQRTPPPA